ncbi:MAG: hypothetical protein ACFCUW_05375 [Kiloniellaceae bacterium]
MTFRCSAVLRRSLAALALAAVAALAACAYRGQIDDPLTLKATWLSYLNGDDLRAACVEGAPTQYRLIYNADYDEQLRSYEFAGDGRGGGLLIARVHGQSGIVVDRMTFSDPMAFARWTRHDAALDAAQLAELDAALAASGAFDPAPRGLQLFSKETYWISNLCRDGVYSFNAWRYPSDRFEAITFDDWLFARDETGVAVRAPVAVPVGASARANVPRQRDSSDERGNYFNVKVGDNGLTSRLAF